MHSTLKVQETGPHGAYATEPDFGFAARADQASPDPVHEVLSLLSKRRAEMASGASVASAAAPLPTVDATFRAAAVGTVRAAGERSAIGRWAKNASVAFLFALCTALAAAVWSHHGDAARQMISGWMPPFMLASSAPAQTPPLAPPLAPVQATAPDQAVVQPAAAQPAEGAAAAAAASSADSAQMLPSMARDMAAMGQQIEQLKAGIAQLRDGQAQMSRDIARSFETMNSERVAALPPRPVAAPPRKPRPTPPPAATASTVPPPYYPAYSAPPQPAPPPQTTVQPDGEPVVRPPMPLH